MTNKLSDIKQLIAELSPHPDTLFDPKHLLYRSLTKLSDALTVYVALKIKRELDKE